MKRLKIVLIVLLSVMMVSICALIGIGISRGMGLWNPFGIHMGGVNVGKIDVGDIDVGRISVGNVGGVGTGNAGADSQSVNTLFTWKRNYSLALEKEILAKDIRSLKINYDMTFNDVIFYQGTGENILVREYMSFTPEDRQISTVKLNGTELEVKGARRNFFSFFYIGSRDAYTVIYLPAGFAESLESVGVKTVSGSILSEIPFAQTGDFAVSSTSGDVFFPAVKAAKIQVSSTSGDVRLASATAEKMNLSTTSGDIMLDQARGKAVISSTSGSIRLWALEGELRVNTTSGDITLGQVEGDMDVSTTSGDVRLEKGRGNLDAESTSGDIRADSLDGAFRMNTTSGTLSISEGSGFGKASSVSGDIRIFLDELRGDLTFSTTSGAVRLQLPETASISLHFDSTSGGCRTFFDEALSFNKRGNKADGQYGGGEHSVQVSTVSGDLTISKD